jgi:hypothetical protein
MTSDTQFDADSNDKLDQNTDISTTDEISIDTDESDDTTEPEIIVENRNDLDPHEDEEIQSPNLQNEEEERQYYPRIIAGPVSAIKKQTKNYIILKPTKSRISVSDTAKKALKCFEGQALDWEKKWIKLTSLNDVIRAFPPGESELIR